MKRITVFCGSSPGKEDSYVQIATEVGKTLAKQHIGLVYGGARIGLMGAVADGALAAGGEVIGVLPRFLKSKEIAHAGLTELIIVESMHDRKMMMNERSDGVIALPGGYGTLEELFEMLTWAQLGLHKKPIGLLNVDGFYDALYALLLVMSSKGFLKEADRQMLLISSNIDELLVKMKNYAAPQVNKWIDEDTV
ncbi:MAG: TIGR00730 family Rossman fold protein [Chitinophagaceae bacterium]|nr:TIGR00730 family Rossman fold protein [Chitinophagaceae bacterium]